MRLRIEPPVSLERGLRHSAPKRTPPRRRRARTASPRHDLATAQVDEGKDGGKQQENDHAGKPDLMGGEEHWRSQEIERKLYPPQPYRPAGASRSKLRQPANAISAYSMTQTGAKTQAGGLKDGLASSAYHPPGGVRKPMVSPPARTRTRKRSSERGCLIFAPSHIQVLGGSVAAWAP